MDGACVNLVAVSRVLPIPDNKPNEARWYFDLTILSLSVVGKEALLAGNFDIVSSILDASGKMISANRSKGYDVNVEVIECLAGLGFEIMRKDSRPEVVHSMVEHILTIDPKRESSVADAMVKAAFDYMRGDPKRYTEVKPLLYRAIALDVNVVCQI